MEKVIDKLASVFWCVVAMHVAISTFGPLSLLQTMLVGGVAMFFFATCCDISRIRQKLDE